MHMKLRSLIPHESCLAQKAVQCEVELNVNF